MHNFQIKTRTRLFFTVIILTFVLLVIFSFDDILQQCSNVPKAVQQKRITRKRILYIYFIYGKVQYFLLYVVRDEISMDYYFRRPPQQRGAAGLEQTMRRIYNLLKSF